MRSMYVFNWLRYARTRVLPPLFPRAIFPHFHSGSLAIEKIANNNGMQERKKERGQASYAWQRRGARSVNIK
jgi:hypothetical protein